MEEATGWDPRTAEVIVGTSAGVPPSVAVSARLAAVNPNPVRGTADITCELAEPSTVTLAIYDVNGARVRTLMRSVREAGAWNTRWDARDTRNQPVAAGVYFVRLDAGAAHATRRVVVTL